MGAARPLCASARNGCNSRIQFATCKEKLHATLARQLNATVECLTRQPLFCSTTQPKLFLCCLCFTSDSHYTSYHSLLILKLFKKTHSDDIPRDLLREIISNIHHELWRNYFINLCELILIQKHCSTKYFIYV